MIDIRRGFGILGTAAIAAALLVTTRAPEARAQAPLTFNGDFHYDLATASPNFVWVGAGLGVMYVNPDGDGESETDPGVNLLIGAGVGGDGAIPYGQAKLMLADDTELGVAVGLRF